MLHRFAKFAAICTDLLLLAGGLAIGTGSGLSVLGLAKSSSASQ
jgi:hypothetical protein